MQNNTPEQVESTTNYSQLNYYGAMIIGVLGLILGLATLAAMFWIANIQKGQSEILDIVKKQTTVQVPIVDNQGLRNALAKPLEGTWKFTTIFTKFHAQGKEKQSEKGRWESIGKAIFIWGSSVILMGDICG